MKARRILVVEDDKLTQKLIADALRSAGYVVDTAHNGATAVKSARENEPDLVTLDIHLAKDSPDDSWDGFSVASWLRRVNEGKPTPIIIVVSGLDPGQNIESAASVSAYTFLPKQVEKKKHIHQAIEKFVHAIAAQRNHHADRHSFAHLKSRDGLTRPRNDRLLAGDLANLARRRIDQLGILRGLAHSHVDDDLLQLGSRHGIVEVELFHERRQYVLVIAVAHT